MKTKTTKCKCGIDIKTISFKQNGKTVSLVEKDFCTCDLKPKINGKHN